MHDCRNAYGKNTDLITTLDYSSEEQKLFIQTIFGETSVCSNTAGEAVANVIMNRVGNPHWPSQDTVQKVIQNTGFDAYKNETPGFVEAKEYLNGTNNNEILKRNVDELIKRCMPIYWRQVNDITNGAVYYYSPKLQEENHKINPELYPSIPSFLTDELVKVKVPGTENDDIVFYKYK